MSKEKQPIDNNAVVTDTDKTDDLSVEQQSDSTATSSETDTKTEQSDNDSLSDENGDDLQTDRDLIEATEPEPVRSEPNAEYMKILTTMDQHLSNLQELFTGQIARDQNQQRMFDTVYNEMKEYKENTLLEAFHKPIINNLIQFYDNFKEVEAQLEDINKASDSDGSEIADNTNPLESLEIWFSNLSEKEHRKFVRSNKDLAAILESVRTVSKDNRPQSQIDLLQFKRNLEIVGIELEEVLYRMDVTPYAERLTKLDKELHKTIKTIDTNNREQDEVVAEIRKFGFKWREKVFRPEEVIIYRYKPSTDALEDTADEKQTAAPEGTVGENPTDNKGDETDE